MYMQILYMEGIIMTDTKETRQSDTLNISVKRSILDVNGLENLGNIIRSKESLIKKALGTGSLRFEVTDEKVTFPWFVMKDPEDLNAYSIFIEKLCGLAKALKRVNLKEDTAVENDKYAFRCFLLRLGMVGDEYKNARKVLLRNLTGSSAFKTPKTKEDKT